MTRQLNPSANPLSLFSVQVAQLVPVDQLLNEAMARLLSKAGRYSGTYDSRKGSEILERYLDGRAERRSLHVTCSVVTNGLRRV